MPEGFETLWSEFSAAVRRCGGEARRGAVHDARVSARRLSALLSAAHFLEPKLRSKWLERRVRRSLSDLGALRDLHVQLSWIRRRAGDDPEMGRLMRALERRTDRERRAVEKSQTRAAHRLASRKGQACSRRLRTGVLEVWRSHPRRSDARLREAFSSARATLARDIASAKSGAPEGLHVARISLKKLRYLREAVAPPRGLVLPTVARMREMQRLLGAVHDLEVLGMTLKRFAKKRGFPDGVEEFQARARRERSALEEKCLARLGLLL